MTTETPELPHALNGPRHELLDPGAGRVSYYTSQPSEPADNPVPLLLIHSVNAAASAHEVRPLFEAYASRRPVFALDLPGYGFSERSDRDYLPRLMIDGIHAVLDAIRKRHGDGPVDALAVSLSCEFLARAADERPDAFRSLALVSSTGLRRGTRAKGPPEANRGSAIAYRILTLPVFGKLLFRGLTSRASVRFFLRKTWGRRDIDERMFEHSWRMTNHPGAHHAPFHFLSGYLFSADIRSVLLRLTAPCWLVHGVRGDFTDFSGARELAAQPNWRITEMQTGALPYFEHTEDFVRAYDDFLRAAGDVTGRGGASDGSTSPARDPGRSKDRPEP